MSDETVRVPAADILALAAKWEADAAGDRDYAASIAGDRRQPYLDTARMCDGHARALRALVSTVERSAAGEGEAQEEARCGGRWNCVLPAGHNMGKADIPENHECGCDGTCLGEYCPAYVPISEYNPYEHRLEDCRRQDDCNATHIINDPAPAGEPLCKCGHAQHFHWKAPTGYACNGDPCDCERFTPAPLSSPRRTRDEGTEDEAEGLLNRLRAVQRLADSREAGDNGFIVVKELRNALGGSDDYTGCGQWDGTPGSGYCCDLPIGHSGPHHADHFWPARAARLAGEDDRG